MGEDAPVNDEQQLTDVVVGDEADAWEAVGFTIVSDLAGSSVIIGSTAIRLVGSSGARGIRSVGIATMGAGELDGMPLTESGSVPEAPQHPNGVTRWDHLVVMSPDSDRTTSVFELAGLEARRVRRFEMAGTPSRQTFFWLGDVILELAGPDAASGDGPSTAWGVALTSPDLDATAASMGDLCGAPKDAVQKGRRIASVRTRDVDISVPIALMTPHPKAR